MNPVATAQTLVSGASLAAASTFIVEYPCDPTNVPVGILWTWSANKNHSVTFGRARASCAAITSIERVTTPVPLTAPDNTAWGYDERIQPSGGFTYLHFVITNNDGANAMSYTVKATPLYDSTAASPGSQAGASGTVDIGTVAIDQTTPGTTNGVYVTGGTVAVTLGSAALEAETVLVNGATVTFGNISAITPFDNHTKLDRYVRFRVSCNKAHTVTFYSADSTFSTLAAGERLRSYTTTGLTDNSTTLGDIYDVEVDGAAYVACVLTNNDGANSATVTIAGRGHN